MEKHLVSVCIPIYNGGQYIKSTIESVLNQTYKNIELVLVNDNSTDNTENIILRFNDSRIKYYKNVKNLGMVNNWNAAIGYATGEYVKLLCQDDLLEKDCIAKQANILDTDNSVQLVTSASYVIDENGKKLISRKIFRKSLLINGKSISKRSFVIGKNLFGEPTLTMYRRSILSKIGYYDKNFWYVPDWDFNVRCLSQGNLYYLNEKLSSFRISKTSQTSEIIKNNRQILFEEDRQFLNKHLNLKTFSMSKFEKMRHDFNTRFRTQLKRAFIKFIN
ncbi:glycosyltransferase family 2 protein [Clostridium felsineum]|uniref:Uncharacterized protein n=1 Tax=Clostridium felsineum TaxID=36839 RepID=A0A1S8L3X6_9CLOT|nr:glycosyltransferase [Clostridium felsineum]URZ07206.1 hypothetical protein CLROS_025390 [Clostridium felsineum]URZ12235.1 hypothetical protein CROST_029520 [Clostridium felsineum]